MLAKAPRGTKDILPKESYKWHYVESVVKEIAERFGYLEIRTPMFEHTELFERSIGETTDIVGKEMYTFEDRGERSVTLKPEGTAPVVRALIENKLYADAQPTKMYYITPIFRYERPQAGRLRQHHQFGIEVFGAINPSVDVEVMHLAMSVYKKLGLKNLELRINSVGCPKCRVKYNEILKQFLGPKLDNLCGTCHTRYEKNPMRIIDCKNDSCGEQVKDVPLMLDNICEECSTHFEGVKKYLDIINIDFVVDPKIVRGLDYYTKTAFEILSDEQGKKGTLCGGGRYDELVKQCGGPKMPGIGFGMGLERTIMAIETQGLEIPKLKQVDIFVVTMSDEAREKGYKIVSELRDEGIRSRIDYLDRSVKAQFKYANKVNARFTIVLGEEELRNETATLKDSVTSINEELALDELAVKIKEKLGRT
ncbi:MAG: histidine--tRNA ligase [Alkaliphilus sp.]